MEFLAATAEPQPEIETQPDQLRLFEIENPLKSRFTDAFFKQIPTAPGVYWMHDSRGRLLYVGKAKNLRNRLRSYRNGSYGRHSSKTRRMLLLVSSIDWQETTSETAALLQENEFLRALKPPFNVQNTKPETYLYLAHRRRTGLNGEDVVELRLMFSLKDAPEDLRIHGAFKGIALLRRGHAALARWLWAASRGDCDWPVTFSRNSAPLVIEVPLTDPAIEARLDFFLSGWLALPELVLPQEAPSGFMQSLWHDDQILLSQLALKFVRHRELRDRCGRPLQTIAQRELDDMIVLSRAESRATAEGTRGPRRAERA